MTKSPEEVSVTGQIDLASKLSKLCADKNRESCRTLQVLSDFYILGIVIQQREVKKAFALDVKPQENNTVGIFALDFSCQH